MDEAQSELLALLHTFTILHGSEKADAVLAQYREDIQTLCRTDRFGERPALATAQDTRGSSGHSKLSRSFSPRSASPPEPSSSRRGLRFSLSQPSSHQHSSSQQPSSLPPEHLGTPSRAPNRKQAQTTLKVYTGNSRSRVSSPEPPPISFKSRSRDPRPQNTNSQPHSEPPSSSDDGDDAEYLLSPMPVPGPDDPTPEDALLGVHECQLDCGRMRIQDLLPLCRLVRINNAPPGTQASIFQSPYHEKGPQGKWYCVYVGKTVGIFNDWDLVGFSVNFVSGGVQQQAATEMDAYRSFVEALHGGRVRISHQVKSRAQTPHR